jgi:hypothetical protein
MERTIELAAGIGAAVIGLTGVVGEAQALSDSVTNPTLAALLATNTLPGVPDAVGNVQHALLPVALVFIALAAGAYLHVVHGQTAGLALLVTCSAVLLGIAGVAVFLPPYAAILFVPAPLVVLTVVLALGASVSALSATGWSVAVGNVGRLRPHRAARID